MTDGIKPFKSEWKIGCVNDNNFGDIFFRNGHSCRMNFHCHKNDDKIAVIQQFLRFSL